MAEDKIKKADFYSSAGTAADSELQLIVVPSASPAPNPLLGVVFNFHN